MKPLAPMTVLCLIALTGCSPKDITEALPDLTPPKPSQVAREAFNVYDADLRRRSINLLSASPFGGEDPYVRTYRLLLDDPDPTVRAAAAKALGLHGDASDVDRMIPRLQDEATFVRWEIANSMRQLHNPSAVKPLMDAVTEDDDPDVRMAAAEALGQYRQRRVYNALVGALEDEHYSVVFAANRSLRNMTGETLGSDGVEWIDLAESRPSDTLFANAQPYTWQPYNEPDTFVRKMKFWKKDPEVIPPQPPKGFNPAEPEKSLFVNPQ